MKKTLLLNNNYEVLCFMGERKTIKMLVTNKASPISYWDDVIKLGTSYYNYPSILVMNYGVHRPYINKAFSRRALVKRDKSQCQYCCVKLSPSQVTIDHILPKSRGGRTNFSNCVVACQPCNSRKDDRTPEESGMKLRNEPKTPSLQHHIYDENINHWHEDWYNYLRF